MDWYKISKYVLGPYYSSKVTLTDGLSLEMCGAIEQSSERPGVGALYLRSRALPPGLRVLP